MTPHQQELIRSIWSQVAPISDAAARIFYDRLFALDLGIAPMFAFTDMQAHSKNLMQTLAVVVKSIDDLATIVPAVAGDGPPSRLVRRTRASTPPSARPCSIRSPSTSATRSPRRPRRLVRGVRDARVDARRGASETRTSAAA